MNKQENEKALEILKADIRRYSKKDISENTESIGLQAVLRHRKEKISAWKLAISALTAQLNNGWIPVVERLPEKYTSFRAHVTFKERSSGEIYSRTMRWSIGKFMWDNGHELNKAYEVIAWMPDYTPEPYKEVSDENQIDVCVV